MRAKTCFASWDKTRVIFNAHNKSVLAIICDPLPTHACVHKSMVSSQLPMCAQWAYTLARCSYAGLDGDYVARV